jgi:hypothetical protein
VAFSADSGGRPRRPAGCRHLRGHAADAVALASGARASYTRGLGLRLARVAACLPVDGSLAALARPPALGARPARDYVGEWLPEPLVAGADDGPARTRWRPRCRLPSSSCSRACRPSSAPRSCCARRSTSPTTGSRRSSAAERPPACRTGPPPRGGAAPPVRGLARQREELATRFFAAAEEGDLQGLEERAGPRRGAPR